jgi:hypothetical protein
MSMGEVDLDSTTEDEPFSVSSSLSVSSVSSGVEESVGLGIDHEWEEGNEGDSECETESSSGMSEVAGRTKGLGLSFHGVGLGDGMKRGGVVGGGIANDEDSDCDDVGGEREWQNAMRESKRQKQQPSNKMMFEETEVKEVSDALQGIALAAETDRLGNDSHSEDVQSGMFCISLLFI